MMYNMLSVFVFAPNLLIHLCSLLSHHVMLFRITTLIVSRLSRIVMILEALGRADR